MFMVIPSFIHNTCFVKLAHDYFSLRINIVKNYFVKNHMSGPYFGWLKHFRRMCRMMTKLLKFFKL